MTTNERLDKVIDVLRRYFNYNGMTGYAEDLDSIRTALTEPESEKECKTCHYKNGNVPERCGKCYNAELWQPITDKPDNDIVEKAKQKIKRDIEWFRNNGDEHMVMVEQTKLDAIASLEAENYGLQIEIVDAHNEQCKLEQQLSDANKKIAELEGKK